MDLSFLYSRVNCQSSERKKSFDLQDTATATLYNDRQSKKKLHGRGLSESDYKCEIFDRLDSRVFYTTNPIWERKAQGLEFCRYFFHVCGRQGPFYWNKSLIAYEQSKLTFFYFYLGKKLVVLYCFEDHSNVSKKKVAFLIFHFFRRL